MKKKWLKNNLPLIMGVIIISLIIYLYYNQEKTFSNVSNPEELKELLISRGYECLSMGEEPFVLDYGCIKRSNQNEYLFSSFSKYREKMLKSGSMGDFDFNEITTCEQLIQKAISIENIKNFMIIDGLNFARICTDPREGEMDLGCVGINKDIILSISQRIQNEPKFNCTRSGPQIGGG